MTARVSGRRLSPLTAQLVAKAKVAAVSSQKTGRTRASVSSRPVANSSPIRPMLTMIVHPQMR